MPDVPFKDEPEQDEEFADKLVALRNKLDDATRVTLTGDPRGRIRRKLLFLTVVLTLTIVAIDAHSVVSTLIAGIGMFALLALAMTDEVVDLG
jgi:hypothetical protein